MTTAAHRTREMTPPPLMTDNQTNTNDAGRDVAGELAELTAQFADEPGPVHLADRAAQDSSSMKIGLSQMAFTPAEPAPIAPWSRPTRIFNQLQLSTIRGEVHAQGSPAATGTWKGEWSEDPMATEHLAYFVAAQQLGPHRRLSYVFGLRPVDGLLEKLLRDDDCSHHIAEDPIAGPDSCIAAPNSGVVSNDFLPTCRI